MLDKFTQMSLFDSLSHIDSKTYDKNDSKHKYDKKSPTEAKLIREKITVYGIDKLIPEEVLSVLTGIDISKCREYVEKYNFSEIIKFLDMLDITPSQRMKLKLLYEFCLKVNTDIRKERPELATSSKAGYFFVNLLKFERIEKFVMGCMDARNRLISIETLFEGTINEAPVYPREAVRIAIGNNANSVIFCHNHPGESCNPSNADLNVTKSLKAAMGSVSISVMDHIIVAGDRYISLAEKGQL